MVFIKQIVLGQSQLCCSIDPKAIESLMKSIEREGILEPLLLRPIEDEKYELVAGERRYRAAKKAGYAKVPAIIREMSDLQALECAIEENRQREQLSPIEEVEAILRLLVLELGKVRVARMRRYEIIYYFIFITNPPIPKRERSINGNALFH